MMTNISSRWLPANPPFSVLAEQGEAMANILRNAYACFPTGVVGICALLEGKPVGMVASSFVPVSIDPPLVSFCVQLKSKTWEKLATLPRLGVSFLSDQHDVTVRRLASKDENKFEGLGLGLTQEGGVLIDGATVWMDCFVENVFPAGDHLIVLMRVVALTTRPYVDPLVFHGSNFKRVQKFPR